MKTRLLLIYLNDHLAGSMAGRELAARCRSSNRGTPLEQFLTKFIEDVDSERAELAELVRSLGGSEQRYKIAAGWLGEKLGRLKLNGQLTGYSPLSRLLELEALCLGVVGKLSLWRSLEGLANEHPAIRSLDVDGLIKRAQSHRQEMERHRLEAAATALGGVAGA